MTESGRLAPISDPIVAAVVSTYRPGTQLEATLRAVKDQVDFTIVVDDTGVGRDYSGTLDRSGAEWIVNDTNLGLAASLNRAIAAARGQDADLILTLDHDTELPPRYVSGLTDGLLTCQAAGGRVLVAGPGTVNGQRLASYGYLHRFSHGVCASNVMQSGMLIDVRAVDLVGGFREEFFIDALEQDFLARLHRRGVHALLVDGVDLTHVAGTPKPVRVFGRTVTPANHSAERNYYIVRNMLVYMREQRAATPQAVAMHRKWLFRHSVKGLLLEADRRAKLSAILRGAMDAQRGQLGPAPLAVRGRRDESR